MIIAVTTIDDTSKALVEEYGGLVQIARTNEPYKCITLVTLPEDAEVCSSASFFYKWSITLSRQEKKIVYLEYAHSCDSSKSNLRYVGSA